MCAPTQTSSNFGPIGIQRNYGPAKQKRFEAEVAKNRATLEKSGYDFNNPNTSALNPFGGPMAGFAEAIWSAKDNEKYGGVGSFNPQPQINNPSVTAPVERKRDFKLNSKNNLETASDYKSKKEGSGSKKRGGSGKLRINKNKTINTPVNSQGGINI